MFWRRNACGMITLRCRSWARQMPAGARSMSEMTRHSAEGAPLAAKFYCSRLQNPPDAQPETDDQGNT